MAEDKVIEVKEAEVKEAEVKETSKETKQAKKRTVDKKAFIARKLKCINKLQNRRLAKFLAEQVLKN